MTDYCLNATATPNQGEVAYGYWDTLLHSIKKISNLDQQVHSQITQAENTGWVSVENYLSVFEEAMAVDSVFGLMVGESVSLKTFPVLGMTLLSCSNLKQALIQILRYESLNHDLGRSELAINPGECSYSWAANPRYVQAADSHLGFQLALSVFAGIKTFAPALLQKSLPIKRINFVVREASNASSIEEFFGCPVFYGQKENSIEVASEVLDWELAFADPTMFTALTKHAETLLANESSKNDFVRRAQAILPEALRRQKFRVEDLARELNLSTRSIQRKLKEQGYTYQSLLDETRLKLATAYLKENDLSMSDIAFMVGYQEQSSFNHAFKNWTGLTPREFWTKRARSI